MDEWFGRYRLDALLGRGGMGEVYRAFDSVKKRHVAVKRLRRDIGSDVEFQRLFRNESERTARLQEPHVIPIHDYGEIDGQLYLEMRLVEGADLGKTLASDGPMRPELAVNIISQIASALDAAHAASMIHRDVKPSNVLLTPSLSGLGTPFAYLVDFGIARLLPEAGGTSRTSPSSMMGTLAYMAPERFDSTQPHTGNAPMFGPSIDIYALACVLYESLVGAKPFVGEPIAMMFGHLTAEPPRPSAARPDVPTELDDVIRRGMAKDPAQRYPTAGALARAAREAVHMDTGPSATPMAPMPTGPQSGPESGPQSRPQTGSPGMAATGPGFSTGPTVAVVEKTPLPSRRQVLIGLTALVGAAGVGVGVWQLVRPAPGALRWSAPTGGQVVRAPKVVGSTVYAASTDGAAYAFNTADGTQRWKFATGGALGSAVDVVGGVVYIGSDDSYLYAVDAGTGKERWRFQTGGIVHTPKMTGGVVYVGCSDKRLYAVDVLTGKQRWAFVGGNDLHTATVSGDTVYIGCSDTNLYAVDSSSGIERWRRTTGGAVSSIPVVSGATVLAGSTDGRLYALATADGTIRWRYDSVKEAASPAVLGGSVFVAASDGGLTALDLDAGTTRWRFGTNVDLNTPTAIGDTIYVGGADRKIYGVDAATGSRRWDFTAGGAVFAPTLADGALYAGSEDQRIYCVSA